jgi:hypothetical protein
MNAPQRIVFSIRCSSFGWPAMTVTCSMPDALHLFRFALAA